MKMQNSVPLNSLNGQFILSGCCICQIIIGQFLWNKTSGASLFIPAAQSLTSHLQCSMFIFVSYLRAPPWA